MDSAACPICLEALDEASSALQMPCAKQHVFHKACLLKWLDERNTCPICRHSMPVAIQEEADEPMAQQRQEGEEEAVNEAVEAMVEEAMVEATSPREQTDAPNEAW